MLQDSCYKQFPRADLGNERDNCKSIRRPICCHSNRIIDVCGSRLSNLAEIIQSLEGVKRILKKNRWPKKVFTCSMVFSRLFSRRSIFFSFSITQPNTCRKLFNLENRFRSLKFADSVKAALPIWESQTKLKAVLKH